MLKVTVVKPTAQVVSWGSNESGRAAGSMRLQEVWIHTVEDDGSPSFQASRVELALNRAKVNKETGETLAPEQPPYPVGEYQLHPSSVYVDRMGKLAFRPRLTAAPKRAG